MKWEYWSGGLIVSVFLHLIVFWPAPDAKKHEQANAIRLSVQLVPVLPSRVTPEDRGSADCCEARSLPSDDSATSSTKRKDRQQIAAEVVRKPEQVPLAAVERVMSKPRTPELLEDAGLVSDRWRSSGVSLARYRLALAAAAVRLQNYPRTAMGAGLEGTVVVDVRLAPEATAPLITVGRSSGIEEMDREAVQLLTRAVMAVPAWQASPGEGGSIRLPVYFELQER